VEPCGEGIQRLLLDLQGVSVESRDLQPAAPPCVDADGW
jgi:hypothetical protein